MYRLLLLFFSIHMLAMESKMEFRIEKSLVENTNFFLKTLFEGIPDIHIVNEGDISLMTSSINNSGFNYIIETKFSEEKANARISEIMDFFHKKNTPFYWYFSPGDTPENLEMLLNAHGFFCKKKAPGMYRIMNTVPELLANTNLCVERIRDMKGINAFCTVHSIDDEEYQKIWKKISSKLFNDDSPVELYIGYSNSIPVTAGIITFYANVGGLNYIGTTPEHQKKGYATELLKILLHRIKNKGYSYTTLTSSIEGEKLYKKFDFKICCTINDYVLK